MGAVLVCSSSIRTAPLVRDPLLLDLLSMVVVPNTIAHLVESCGDGVKNTNSTKLTSVWRTRRHKPVMTYVLMIAKIKVPRGRSQLSSPFATSPVTLLELVASLLS